MEHAWRVWPEEVWLFFFFFNVSMFCIRGAADSRLWGHRFLDHPSVNQVPTLHFWHRWPHANSKGQSAFCLSAQSLSHVWLCDLMDCSTPGFPLLWYLPELAQTHVYQVGDIIQPSHPLSPPSPPAINFFTAPPLKLYFTNLILTLFMKFNLPIPLASVLWILEKGASQCMFHFVCFLFITLRKMEGTRT